MLPEPRLPPLLALPGAEGGPLVTEDGGVPPPFTPRAAAPTTVPKMPASRRTRLEGKVAAVGPPLDPA